MSSIAQHLFFEDAHDVIGEVHAVILSIRFHHIPQP